MGTLTGQGVEMFHCKIDIQITQIINWSVGERGRVNDFSTGEKKTVIPSWVNGGRGVGRVFKFPNS